MYNEFVMKRFTIFLAVALVILGAATAARAQDATQSATSSPVPSPTEAPFNFEKAFKDYIFTQDTYNRAHADYILAKGQYLQANTLASNAKAREATAAMLTSRDDVLIVYLIALRQRLVESIGIPQSSLDGLNKRLETEISWYKTHKGRITSASTLEDLSADSESAKKHYATTEPLIYETLSSLPIGKVTTLRSTFTDILSSLKVKTNKIRTNGDLDTTTAERWIIETENKLARSVDKQVEAQGLILTISATDVRTQQVNKSETYNQVNFRLDESLQFMKEASKHIREVLKQLKTKPSA